jgi:hypothetical protein
MGNVWKDHFHWSVLLGWNVLGWIIAMLVTAAGLLLFFGHYGGANVCFSLTALFIFAKIAQAGIATNDSALSRLLFTFALFGVVGVGIVETVRGVNNWGKKKATPQSSGEIAQPAAPAESANPQNTAAQPSRTQSPESEQKLLPPISKSSSFSTMVAEPSSSRANLPR